MSEIKVVPYIPDEDYDNPAMVVDFYEFTMANCLFLNGFKDTTLVFDMFFRKNPDNQGYSISAGQRKLTRFLLNYHFNEQDVHWLRTKGMSEEFCEYLRTYRWKGDMYALPEGTVCYPHVQMVRIECDLVGAILIETYLLQTMNFHSLIATKATRVTGLNTHTPRSVMEFGTRRAQGESAGNDGAYAAVLGGCIGTANCLAEMKYGSEVKAVGTVAHSFIEFFPTEFDAFKAFADTYPDSVSLLLDTYNIMESGLPNLIKLDDYLIEKYPNDPNRRVKSARIDSGDLARGSKRLRKALDDKKDQSYVLYNLSQEQLAHTLFPLGELHKDQVRAIAEENGFINAHKRESQDICFVPDGDYAAFIESYTGRHYPPGDFVDTQGNVLGRHKGIIRYTIGQRRGLGLALPAPLYVCKKDPESNTVTLCPNDQLNSTVVRVTEFNWLSIAAPAEPLHAAAKIRYNMHQAPCTVEVLPGGDVQLTFDTPQRAVTPGQAAVVYAGDTVLGGGRIV